jgi:transcriptional regulator with XRE-family HTH domain
VPKDAPRDQIASLVIAELRKRRETVGMSMNMLAEKSGLSLTMISFVERRLRKPTLDTLLRMTEALDVSLSVLLKKAEESVPRK